ncbi:golgin subfamily A member 2-like isoform X4 [Falco biarmicus]|uniref:golgin subfamily A member 2-like isoform X4 n=1 Tax=Falco biarmicus TaxID=345155 RepID=UPI0024BC7E71|nr:golgin subfamily A member 2-like isoform X4 [Falco biarmicus]
MADSSRQSRLAAAKKKLKEYQQKNSPGAAAGTKKKRKTKDDCRPETPTGDDQQPPENKQQNQEAVDQLEKEKMELEEKFSEEQAALREQLQVHIQTIGILVSEKSECQTALAPTQRAAREKSGEAESFAARLHSSRQRELELERTLASVSLQQKQAEKRNAELMKEREDLKQELYKQSKSSEEIKQQNSELSEKVRCLVSEISAKKLYMEDLHKKLEMAELMIQQKQQNQEAVDQLEKEKMELEEKFSEEQAALREQLQVHIQTIGILVSEKSECQTALAPTQRAAREKSGEAESFAARLRSSRQRELELERTLASVSLQQKQAEKRNAELMKEREDLKQELYKQSKSSEEIKQQNAELSEKFRCLVSKISAKELYMKDLRKKLEMAELMIQQLSESVHQLQAERDQYVGELKEEQSIWQQQVQQLSEQVHAMADEKEEHMARGDDDVDS